MRTVKQMTIALLVVISLLTACGKGEDDISIPNGKTAINIETLGTYTQRSNLHASHRRCQWCGRELCQNHHHCRQLLLPHQRHTVGQGKMAQFQSRSAKDWKNRLLRPALHH